MKKQQFKSLQLHKNSISSLTNFSLKGGADGSGLRVTCAICVVSKKPEFCIGDGPDDAPGPGGGTDSDYFSCPGNNMPSCHYSDCC